MPSLSQLLTNHERVLVLDAASTNSQVGLLQRGGLSVWRHSAEEAGAGIFKCTEAVLLEAEASLEKIDAFIFCEGPGSMLGIRTVAMALRTWQVLRPRPAYAFQSLATAGYFAWSQGGAREFAVIADARRDTWHCQTVLADGRMPALERVPTAELTGGEYVTPENFRAGAPTPGGTRSCSYDLAQIFPALAGGDFFRLTDAPETFQHAAPEYKKWSAQIHSAATADPQ